MRNYLSLSILLPLFLLAGGCTETLKEGDRGRSQEEKAENSPEMVVLDSERYDSLAIVRERIQKDAALREEGSPILAEKRSTFTGLRYFPVDPGLAFHVTLERLPKPEPFKMAATKGDVRAMRRLGHFTFMVDGREQKLTAFSSESHPEMLFIPFRDPTNGEESYEVGRYIDLEVREDDRYLLDFNRAYNPYCAYNPEYTCPVVPNENILETPIRAGEMNLAGMAH